MDTEKQEQQQHTYHVIKKAPYDYFILDLTVRDVSSHHVKTI